MKELRAMRQSVHLPSEGPLDPVVESCRNFLLKGPLTQQAQRDVTNHTS